MPTRSYEQLLSTLTEKQRTTLDLLSQRLTGAEAAERLGISESAINQRFEKIRLKLGGGTSKSICAKHRNFLDKIAEKPVENPTAGKFHLPPKADVAEQGAGNDADIQFEIADAMTFEVPEPWTRKQVEVRVVPEVLEGRNATVSRWMLAIGLAIGMTVLTVVSLTVAAQLTELV